MWQNREDLPFFDALMGWVRSANRLANKPYRQSAGFLQNANLFLETKKRQFLDFQPENSTKLTLSLAPRTGFEPAAYRLGVGSAGLRRLLTNHRKALQTLTFFKFYSPRFTTVSC